MSTSTALLFAAPGPSHVLVVDDDPILHFALAQAAGIRDEDLVPLAPDDEDALLRRPGTIGFEYSIPFTSVRTIAERLRWMIPRTPVVAFVANVREVAARCVEAGVPVFGVGAPVEHVDGEEQRRVARLFVIDDGQPSLLPELAPDSVG
jgi:hypothetical protein